MASSPRDLTGHLWRYGVTGMVNTGFGLAIIFVLHLWGGLSVALANALGYGVGLAMSFALNRSWTFAHHGNIWSAALRYGLLVLAAFMLNLALIYALLTVGLPYALAQICGVIFYSVVVFLGARHAIFKA